MCSVKAIDSVVLSVYWFWLLCIRMLLAVVDTYGYTSVLVRVLVGGELVGDLLCTVLGVARMFDCLC